MKPDWKTHYEQIKSSPEGQLVDKIMLGLKLTKEEEEIYEIEAEYISNKIAERKHIHSAWCNYGEVDG